MTGQSSIDDNLKECIADASSPSIIRASLAQEALLLDFERRAIIHLIPEAVA